MTRKVNDMPVASIQPEPDDTGDLHDLPRRRRPRTRLVAVTVQLDVVTDDGDTLTPVGVQPIRLTAAEWHQWSLDATVAEIDRQLATKPQ